MKELRIGALVVTGDTPPLVGIFSERDVVRALATDGVDALSMSVARYMSTDVVICHEATTMQGLMSMMTQRRIRHVPVVENNVLVGMISIGDVVKSRLDELEHEKEDLIQFISAH